MKMKRVITVFFCCFPAALFAQWQPAGTTTDIGNIYHLNGNVGIGTNNPQYFRLDILDQNKNEAGIQSKASLGGSSSYSLVAYTSNYTTVPSYANKVVFQTLDNPIVLSAFGTSSNNQIQFYTGGRTEANKRMVLDQDGNLGLGIMTPTDRLAVNGNISMPLQNSIGFGQSDRFTYDSKSIGNYTIGWYGDSQNASAAMSYLSSFGGIKFFTQSSARVTISQNGNVGIGTTTPDAKLAVLGTIHTNEVKVDLSVSAPDYVFESTYALPTLDELSAYIKVNKHLPEVPSACVMAENGVNLGEMNMLLLKKVEELTLYMIELKKQIDDLKAGVQKRR